MAYRDTPRTRAALRANHHKQRERWAATFVERFWARYQKQADGCWLWTGGRQAGDYGCVHWPGGPMRLAHRTAWMLTHGPIPKGLCVLHVCDTPLCVNPKHLWLGTLAANNRDMRMKGRSRGRSGELTGPQVQRARRLLARGHTQRSVAQRLGVSQPTIWRIAHGAYREKGGG